MSRRDGLTPAARARRKAALRAVEFLLMVVLLTAWAYLGVTAPLLGAGAMAGGIAFVLVQCVFVPAIVGHVVLTKFRRTRREHRSAIVLPELRAALAAYASGAASAAALHRYHRRYPCIVEGALLDFIPAVSGSQRGRLVELAEQLDLPPRWIRDLEVGAAAERRAAVSALAALGTPLALESLRRAMHDDIATVRADAYRAVLRCGTTADVVAVTVKSLGENLLTRAMLADDLKPHAATLTERVIPALLADEESLLLGRTLDLLASWRVLVRFDAVQELLGHADPRIVARALEILPFTPQRAHFTDAVVARLDASDDKVRCAAAFCAGRTRLLAAAPVLGGLLYDDSRAVARAAAVALARFGAEGRSYLDAAVVARDRRGAGFALEALEHSRVRPRLAVGQ